MIIDNKSIGNKNKKSYFCTIYFFQTCNCFFLVNFFVLGILCNKSNINIFGYKLYLINIFVILPDVAMHCYIELIIVNDLLVFAIGCMHPYCKRIFKLTKNV